MRAHDASVIRLSGRCASIAGVIALAALLLMPQIALRPELSEPSGAADPAVRRRRGRRRHRADRHRKARRKARAAFHHREHAGRRRHHGRPRGAVVAARRLYAGAAQQRHRDLGFAVQEPEVQSGHGFRSGLEHGLFRLHLRHPSRLALQDAGGSHQGGEGKARRAQCRHHQCRLDAKPLGAIVQIDRRRRRHHRSVPQFARRADRAAARRYPDGDRELHRRAIAHRRTRR